MLANLRGDPEHPKASPADAQAVMLQVVMDMTPEERDQFGAGMDGTDPEEECEAYQLLFRHVSTLPVADQLTIVRATFE
jgi:hypothetical protein